MSKVRLVIIGNGMVGHRYIEDLVEKAEIENFDVTVFCEEPRVAYDRVHLSSYFSHHTAAAILPLVTSKQEHNTADSGNESAPIAGLSPPA